jgi:hypothetical protein
LRFTRNGPTIPDELLVARDEGRVVFFCGAGVSRAKAGLKDFLGLARSVADKLAITSDGAARQLINTIETFPPIAGVGSLVSADRVFGLIEREFLSGDIYRAIAAALKPEGVPDLTAHRLLLDLAKGPDGTVRLITTNFDLLFEDSDPTIPFSKPPRLPDPLRSDEFGGIIHLHGHVTADYSDAAGDGFVISSAEFGRAYLSERWAADFIRTVLERFFVVFIGYSADDPPMQYLLEALNRSPGSLNGAYAFQSGSYEDAEARWIQKGVKPIVYEDSSTHAALWDTLALWSERARDPTAWYDRLLSRAKVGPEKCEPYERGQIAHVVSTLEGAKRFAQAVNPLPADWLCTFDPYIRFAKPGRTGSLSEPGPYFDPFAAYGLDSDPVPANIDSSSSFEKRDVPANAWSAFALTRSDRQNLGEDQVSSLRGHWSVFAPRLAPRVAHLGNWLQRVAGQPAAVWWAALQIGIHPDLQRQIEYNIGAANTETSAVVRKAWRYLIGSWRNPRDDFSGDWYQLLAFTKVDGWTPAAIREFAKIHRPRFKVGRAFYGSPRAPEVEGVHLRELIHLDVKYPHYNDEPSIPDEFLPSLIKELRNNLEVGIALEEEIGGYGLHNLDAIEPDEEQDRSERSFKSGVIVPLLGYVKLLRRLLQIDDRTAKVEMLAWRNSNNPVATHLKIWSCSIDRLVNRNEVSAVLRTVSREDFWEESHQRDLLIMLRKRWNNLLFRTRVSVERRLLRGRKKWKGENNKDFKQRRASSILSRIHWLSSKECKFSFDLDEVTKRHRKDYPEWQMQWASTASLSRGMRTGLVKTDTSSDDLTDQPLANILEAAAKLSGRSPDDFLIERDPYAGLCASKPSRAFSALTVAGKAGNFPQGSWQTFLNHGNRKTDTLRFVTLIAGRLSLIPDGFLNGLLRPVADWLLRIHKSLLPSHRHVLDRLWKRIVALLKQDQRTGVSSIVRGTQKPDWATEALNSPVGHLAQVMMSDPAISKIKAADHFPDWWKARANELLSLSGDRRRHALAIFCHNLVWLFAVDPQWVIKAFLPMIDQQDDDSEAFWAGFFWGANVPQEQLYIKMKPALMRLAHKNSDTRRKHAEILAGIILAGWGSKIGNGETRAVTNSEMTALIIDADDDFRTQLVWHLENWSNTPDTHWADDAITLLNDVWPRQIAAKTPRVSAKLTELAFAHGEQFPLYVNCILPLVVPIDQDYINLPIIERNKSNLVDKFPESALAILHAVLTDDARKWPYGMSEILDCIGLAEPRLLTDGRLIQLNRIRNSF